MSPLESAPVEQNPTEKDQPPESTAPPPSHPSPYPQSPITQTITLKTVASMDTSADVPPVSVEEAIALYNSSQSHQESLVSSDDSSIIMVDSADYIDETDGDINAKKKKYLVDTEHTSDASFIQEAPDQTETPPDEASQLIRDSFYPIPQIQGSGLSTTAPPPFLVDFDTTVVGESQDEDINESSSVKAHLKLPNPSTPISQISEVAAEVADTAATLDATPIDIPTTPEILSILDDMSVHAGSPIVELVEESFLPPLSETSRTAAEVADTAAMLDYSPDDHLVIGLTTEQTPEQVQVGVIRIVQTNADDSLVMIEEDVAAEGGESLKNDCASQAESTKFGIQLTPTPSENQTTPTKDTMPQAGSPDLVSPHMETDFETTFQNDISDSDFLNMSTMSNLSIDQLDKDLSTEKLIDSICLEDLVILASNVYARTWDVPTHRIKCVVNPNLKRGSKNLFYLVELSERRKPQRHKWVFRIPLLDHFFGGTQRSWLESDIRAIKFIKNYTDIPIPFVYEYDFSTQNRIGTPYILLEFMEGHRVEDVWEGLCDEQRMRCLSQCAKSMGMLGEFKFDRIGVLGPGYAREEYAVRSIPSDTEDKETLLHGPYPSIKTYLDDIWRTKTTEIINNTPEAAKSKQILFLLKLLTPVLMDLESTAQHFSLSFPEFGGRNVLVDRDGNVTAFVGWDKVMIVPKEIGYARYPEWIIKDWTPPPHGKFSEANENPGENLGGDTRKTKSKAVPEINRKSLTMASLNSGKTIETVKDSEGIIRGYLLEESEDTPEKTILNFKTSAPPSPSINPENGYNNGQAQTPLVILAPEGGPTVSCNAAGFQALPSVHTPIDCQTHEDLASTDSGRGRKKQKGRKDRQKNGGWKNRQSRKRHDYDYNESAELQRAITDEDKSKIQAVSRWNSLPKKINRDEAEEKEERKRVWMAKGEEEKITAVKQARTLPRVSETFKKVIVEQDLERKLLKVIKTERTQPQNKVSNEDIEIVAFPQTPSCNDMARYREMYHECFMKIAPEDGLANKFSHISTAVHIATTNDMLRPSIVPKLARHVFGAAVRPSLLGMIGGGQWAKELLIKVNEENYDSRKFMKSLESSRVKGYTENGFGSIWELLIIGPTLAIGAIVIILGMSISLAWILGFFKCHLHFLRSYEMFTVLARLSFGRLAPELVQSPVVNPAKAAAQSLAVNTGHVFNGIFDKYGVINLAFDSSIALGLVFVLFLVLKTPRRTEAAEE